MKGMSRLLFYVLASGVYLLASCSGGGDGDTTAEPRSEPEPVQVPSAASLIFPTNNSECNEGEIISNSQSRVLFQWNASRNTDNYQVNLTNLNTNSTSRIPSREPEAEITLLRGVPYEWFVVSLANGTNETASSPVWRFYNAGPGISNYAPFPAVALAPSRGATIPAAESVTLEWAASDIDDDISSYDLYFGTEDPPALLQEGLVETSFEAVITSGQTYYWEVETIDEAGNRTRSERFNFRVD
jgi:hypothetical protein